MRRTNKNGLKNAIYQVTIQIAGADHRLQELTALEEERNSLHHLRSALDSLEEALEASAGKEKP